MKKNHLKRLYPGAIIPKNVPIVFPHKSHNITESQHSPEKNTQYYKVMLWLLLLNVVMLAQIRPGSLEILQSFKQLKEVTMASGLHV